MHAGILANRTGIRRDNVRVCNCGGNSRWRERRAMALRIEDYALIGDCKTAALVGRDGSIDWLCWPRFDSAACFAALLGEAEHGRWRIAPKESRLCTSRRYRPGTLVLETEFRTETGSAAVIDFMPPGDGADLVWIVTGQSGRVVFKTELVVRFNYGAAVPWVDRLDDGSINAIAGPERVLLRTPVALYGEDLRTVGEFAVEAGQSISFALSYGASFQSPPPAIDALDALARTEASWHKWSDRCPDVGPWTEAVKRSLITLKALTYAPRSEEHTSELQSLRHLVCRLLLEKKKKIKAPETMQKNTRNLDMNRHKQPMQEDTCYNLHRRDDTHRKEERCNSNSYTIS